MRPAGRGNAAAVLRKADFMSIQPIGGPGPLLCEDERLHRTFVAAVSAGGSEGAGLNLLRLAFQLAKSSAARPSTQSALRSVDDPQVRTPRPDFIRVLPRQHSRDLHHVIEVVRHPRRKKLAKRHDSKRWMPPAAVEVGAGQLQTGELAKALLPQRRELVEQARQRPRL